MAEPVRCTVEGCRKPSRSKSPALCPMHYHRKYRHGDVNKVASTSPSISNGRRYKLVRLKGHPLASKNGQVYVHRLVLWQLIGPGAHNCHWCGRIIRWDSERRDPDALHVDHLNDHGDDNRPENLVASCPRCNIARGRQRSAAALRESGWWSAHDTIERLSGKCRLPKIVRCNLSSAGVASHLVHHRPDGR